VLDLGKVIIVPINDNHLDRNTWDIKVGPQREKEKQHQSNNLFVLKSWIKSSTQQCFSSILSEFYTIHKISPEPSCGSCPSCVNRNRVTQFFPVLGRFAQVYGLSKLEQWPDGLNFNSLHQGVYYSVNENDRRRDPVRSLIRGFIPWISSLLEKKQVHIIRTDMKHVEAIQSYLPKGFNQFWAFESLSESSCGNETRTYPYWSELVVVPTDFTKLPDFDFEFEQSPKFILAKKELPAPTNPIKQWWLTDSNAISLNNFLLSMN
jgi:hypothetical protein